MVQRQTSRDGTTRLLSGNVATRWGTTPTWPYYGGETNQPVSFADGRRARLGDMVFSTHVWSDGQACTVVKVYPDGKVDFRVENFRIRLAADTLWKYVGAVDQPAFATSWSNYGDPFQEARFRKVDGTVYLEGLVKTSSGSAGPIFVLPEAFRPLKNHLYAAAVSGIYTSENGDTTTSSETTGGTHTHTVPTKTTLGPNNDTVVHSHDIAGYSVAGTNTTEEHTHSLDQHKHEVASISARVDVQSDGQVLLVTPIHAVFANAFVSLSAISYYVKE